MASGSSSDSTSRGGTANFKVYQEHPADSAATNEPSSQVSAFVIHEACGAAKLEQSAVPHMGLPMTTSKLANQQGRTPNQDPSLKVRCLKLLYTCVEPIADLLQEAPSVSLRGQQQHPSLSKSSNSASSISGSVNHNFQPILKALAIQIGFDPLFKLQDAKQQIAGLHQQLSQHQITQHTIDHVLASPEPMALRVEASPEALLKRLHLGESAPPKDPAIANEPSSSHPFDAPNHSWGNLGSSTLGKAPSSQAGWNSGSAWNAHSIQGHPPSQQQTQPSGTLPTPMTRAGPGPGLSLNIQRGWSGSVVTSNPSTASFTPPLTPFEHPHLSNTAPWHPRAAAAPFAPVGAEMGAPWNACSSSFDQTSQQQYLPPTEPINYRRLLDRNVSCSWKYIVDKIICSNDQQASIFLQQKLKVSPAELKLELVDAIIDQAYPLMINRFGNFLIQRCLEHGSPEQVNAIANTIRGKTLELSMDAFGCHVVQKALDVVPETYKASMVHELLRQVPQTVVHRYACHVWQKLFELRWKDSPPQIMRYVNEALCGMWHEVALGETGSLVVQNIFENCLDEDKRPCVTEVLQKIDIVAHGQFGNWCIQHVCEHGAPSDKRCAIEHVLQNATSYSTDQFASKVVEKCLKVGGADFLDRYLSKVCEARPDRPRMPLIDIAGDQYGNYLIQHILLNADVPHRETVAQHIRKHMVSLRGSKFGSRVALLCCNPSVTTRPGPPVPFNDRFYNPYAGITGRNALPGSCR
ncbi:MAG: hypothetical protein Q9162_006600 [Coniocarpon cinnabarinum]